MAAILLQVLRLHPRASTPVPQGIPNSDQGIQQSQDISVITEGAAYSQSIAELTDWLGSAKIALQVRLPHHMSSVLSAWSSSEWSLQHIVYKLAYTYFETFWLWKQYTF